MKLSYIRILIFITLTILFTGNYLYAQTATEYMEKGRDAFLNYDFEEAGRLYGLAQKKLKNESSSLLNDYKRELALGRGFLDRVEKIIVLDSIAVPKDDFFKAYRLPVSSGSLDGNEALPFKYDGVDYVFTNEGDDFKMWSQPDSIGNLQIMESIKLTDGKWSAPIAAPNELGAGKNASYPFMMADGVTLYYASDGMDSMGGYDIFIVSRDASTGEYLQPQNIGMPYNSPYDDYLLAVDELNGIGWWATDRNQLDDLLTIYIYKLNDLRSNYDPDAEENIEDLARITDYKSTQPEDENYDDLLREIKNIKKLPVKKADFYFPVTVGTIYTTLEDFRSSEGRMAMKKYLEAVKQLDMNISELSRLRREYHANKSVSIAEKIKSLELSIENEREKVDKLRSDVYKAERSKF